MPFITMTSERTGHWTKMRRPFVPFSKSGISSRTRYSADCITITSGFRFSVHTGKRSDRPELEKALEACRRHKAKLVIAKLDRLSRNLAFIATLMESSVEFVAVDNPHASKLTVHILAAVAQHEREMISERTKAALQAAKARGKRLGNPRLSKAAARGTAAGKAAADQFAANVLPVIREIQASGVTSHNAIAAKLNERRVKTARGGRWSHVQVAMILARPPVTNTEPKRSGTKR